MSGDSFLSALFCWNEPTTPQNEELRHIVLITKFPREKDYTSGFRLCQEKYRWVSGLLHLLKERRKTTPDLGPPTRRTYGPLLFEIHAFVHVVHVDGRGSLW
jgi:hypothetical protein